MNIDYLYNPQIVIPQFLLDKIQISDLVVGHNIISQLEKYLPFKSKHLLLLADVNTFQVAGKDVLDILIKSGNNVKPLILEEKLHCDKTTADIVENALSGFNALIVIGSGTLNDIGRLAAHKKKVAFYTIGTAPSMDGYLSANSSLIENGIKISYADITPAVKVLIDLDVMYKSPLRLLKSGIGDSLAKITSVFDWQLDSLMRTTDFDCNMANLLNDMLGVLLNSLLINKESASFQTVMEFLLLSSAIMNAYRNSQPASGGEHFVSHILEMIDLNKNNIDHAYHGEKVAVSFFSLYHKYIDFFTVFLNDPSCFEIIDTDENYFRNWNYYDIKIKRNIIETKINIMRNFNFNGTQFKIAMKENLSMLKNFSLAVNKVYEKFSLQVSNADIKYSNDEWNFALLHAGDIRERITGIDLINLLRLKD